jgi:hypothetical protein
MNNIYVFFIRNDIWIYILCALGLFWYASTLVRARLILRQAMFGLERERGQRLQSTALTFIILFAAIAGVVGYVNVEIAPTVPAELLKPATPTPNIFATPLFSPTPLGSPAPDRPSPTPPIVPTVTLRSPVGAPAAQPPAAQTTTAQTAAAQSPNPTRTPAAPGDNGSEPTRPSQAGPAVGCSAVANITTPASGAIVSGAIPFFGSAGGESFAFYKLEANGPETNGLWASIIGGTVDRAVENGLLGTANMGSWTAGVYTFRLTVVDVTSNESGQCTIQLQLAN